MLEPFVEEQVGGVMVEGGADELGGAEGGRGEDGVGTTLGARHGLGESATWKPVYSPDATWPALNELLQI